jgi:hypothetical protein
MTDYPSIPSVVGPAGAAAVLGLTERRVRQLCMAGQIQGAAMFGGCWVIPVPVTVLPKEVKHA